MPPSPILLSTRYSPTSVPSPRSAGPAAPPRRRSMVGSSLGSFIASPAPRSSPPAPRDEGHAQYEQRDQTIRRRSATDLAAATAAAAATTTIRAPVGRRRPARAAAAGAAAATAARAHVGDVGAARDRVRRLACAERSTAQ